MDILVHLELNYSQAAIAIDRQQIDDAAIAPGELRHLTVNRLGEQRGVQRFQVSADPPFEPGFRLPRRRRSMLLSTSGIEPRIEVGIVPWIDPLFVPSAVVHKNHILRTLRVEKPETMAKALLMARRRKQ